MGFLLRAMDHETPHTLPLCFLCKCNAALSSLFYRGSLAVHSAVFSLSACQQGARSSFGILSMKCNPFGLEGQAQEKRWGYSLIQFSVLFQVLMTSLY